MKRWIHAATRLFTPREFVKRILMTKLGRPTRIDRGQLIWWNMDLPFERDTEDEAEYRKWIDKVKTKMNSEYNILVSDFINYPTSWNFTPYPQGSAKSERYTEQDIQDFLSSL